MTFKRGRASSSLADLNLRPWCNGSIRDCASRSAGSTPAGLIHTKRLESARDDAGSPDRRAPFESGEAQLTQDAWSMGKIARCLRAEPGSSPGASF